MSPLTPSLWPTFGFQPWYIHINQYLHHTSLCKTDVNGNLYILAFASSIILLILYVDDLLIIGSNHALLQTIVFVVKIEFVVMEFGPIQHYLGVQFQ
jgi:histone deacetylase 1/2